MMESLPTPEQPLSPEERKKRIEQLNAELQSISQEDDSRGKKLKELISLIEEDERYEKGDIDIDEKAYHFEHGKNPNSFAETEILQPSFTRIKNQTE